MRNVLLHFYKKERADDARVFMSHTPNQFVEMQQLNHIKQDPSKYGNNEEELKESEYQTRRRADNFGVDDDGFTVIKRR